MKMPETLILLQTIKYKLESGEAIRPSLAAFASSHQSELGLQVATWISLLERGLQTSSYLAQIKSPVRRQMFFVFERGLRGESILGSLVQMESELLDHCYEQIEKHMVILPLKMLLPLMGFIFPAFLIIVLGPLIQELVRAMGQM